MDKFSIVGNDILLNLHGSMRYNDFKTVRQAWDMLDSTPYHPSKAASYSRLRQMMLKEMEVAYV